MDFFALQDRFWQLELEQPFSPTETKLYFYFLNRFNAARWPAVLRRFVRQVAADLTLDEKTATKAVAGLHARGLLAYEAGTRSQSASWALADDRNNSGQQSPRTSRDDRKNSGNKREVQPRTSRDDRKNSGPYKEEEENVEEEENKKKAGVAAEEITTAPLPAKNLQLVPPVAEPPHAGQPGPVAAAELEPALAAEAKALANEIAPIWDLSEIKHQPKWARIHGFTRCMARLGRLPEVKQQLAGYRAGHLRPGVRPHQLDKWLGSAADDYAGGEWCGCDWPSVAAKAQVRQGYGPVLPEATVGTTSSPTKARQAKSW